MHQNCNHHALNLDVTQLVLAQAIKSQECNCTPKLAKSIWPGLKRESPGRPFKCDFSHVQLSQVKTLLLSELKSELSYGSFIAKRKKSH